MSVTTSYPGVYIQELPSTSHSVTPATTSVTVFVGYTNPFWTSGPNATPPPFGSAVQLFSFADYQATFGGFFNSPWLPDYVGQAVSQFFQNGGAQAYVIALQAGDYFDPTQTPLKDTSIQVTAPQAALVKGSNGFTFTALQPVALPSSNVGLPMTVTVSNLASSPSASANSHDIADLTIVYGTRVETYRRVAIGDLVGSINGVSSLVTVAVTGTTPAGYDTLVASSPLSFQYAKPPTAGWTIINPVAFGPTFAANAPLDKVSSFNLMALPGISDPTALAQALAYCEQKRAFFIMDPPATAVADSLAAQLPSAPANPAPMADIFNGAATNNPPTPAPPMSANGAIYFPYLQTTDPVTGAPAVAPPSGFVAGIFANEDNTRGVWKSPAGLETIISGTVGVVPWGAMTDPQQGVLNNVGVNCLRTFPDIGTVVFGARTLVSANPAYEQWKYVAVRRMALFIEQSLYSSLRWAIFEPNAAPLWSALTQEVEAFMLGLYRQGAFQGQTASDAFQVTCDDTTTSQNDIDQGRVNILVAFAPLKPAEFVVVQIQQLAGQTQS